MLIAKSSTTISLPPLHAAPMPTSWPCGNRMFCAVLGGTHEPEVRGSGVGRARRCPAKMFSPACCEPAVGGDEDRSEVLVPVRLRHEQRVRPAVREAREQRIPRERPQVARRALGVHPAQQLERDGAAPVEPFGDGLTRSSVEVPTVPSLRRDPVSVAR